MSRFVACLALSVLGIVGTLAGCKAAEEAKKDNTQVTLKKEIPAGKRLTVDLSGTADEADLKLLQACLVKRIGAATADFAGVTDRDADADATLNVKVATLTVNREPGVTAQTIFAKCIYNVELVDKADGPLFSAVIEDFASVEISSSVGDASAHMKDVKTEVIKSSVAKLYKQIERCIKQEKWDQPKKLEVADVPKMRLGVFQVTFSGDAATVSQWTSFVEQQLMATSFLQVINQSELAAAMETQKLTNTGAFDERTVGQLGKLLGAKYMIRGAATEAGGTITLTLDSFDGDTGAKVYSTVTTAPVGQRQKVAYQAAYKLAQELAARNKM